MDFNFKTVSARKIFFFFLKHAYKNIAHFVLFSPKSKKKFFFF